MRKIATIACIISIALISVGNLFAQSREIPIDENLQKIKFQETVNANGTDDYLWNQCVSWLNTYYVNAARITDVRDYSSKKIMGRHTITLKGKDAPIVNYRFIIEIRPNRYRYTITEFTIKGLDQTPVEFWMNKEAKNYDPKWGLYLDQIAAFADEWTSSLEKKMQFEKKVVEDEDW